MSESKFSIDFLDVLCKNPDLEIFDGNFKLRDRNHEVWLSIKEKSKTLVSAKAIFLMFKFNNHNLRDDAQDLFITRRRVLDDTECPLLPFEFVNVPCVKEEAQVSEVRVEQKFGAKVEKEDACPTQDIKPPPSLSIVKSEVKDMTGREGDSFESSIPPFEFVNVPCIKEEAQVSASKTESTTEKTKPAVSLKRSRPLVECPPTKIPRYDADAVLLKRESDDDDDCEYASFYEDRSFIKFEASPLHLLLAIKELDKWL